MKLLFILLTFLFSVSSMGSTVGNQVSGCATTSIQVDGRCIDLTNSNVKIIHAAGVTSGTYDTFRIMDGGLNPYYQTASSTKAVVLGFKTYTPTSATIQGSIFYSDADGRDQATGAGEPSNAVYCGGSTNTVSHYGQDTTERTSERSSCALVVPTGKYIQAKIDTTNDQEIIMYIGECADTGTCEFHN